MRQPMEPDKGVVAEKQGVGTAKDYGLRMMDCQFASRAGIMQSARPLVNGNLPGQKV